MDSHLNNQSPENLWNYLEAVNELIYVPAAPSDAEIDAAVAILQHYRQATASEKVSNVLPFKQAAVASETDASQGEACQKRFHLITEYERFAASTAIDDFPLPDPDQQLMDKSGRFLLELKGNATGQILIILQAQGMTVFEFARKTLAFISSGEETPMVELTMDDQGRAQQTLENSPENRKALARFQVVQLDD